MTNQEIADKLAEVMGWVPSPGNSGWVDEANPRFFTARQAWHPATDLNQAVQAAEKLETLNDSVELVELSVADGIWIGTVFTLGREWVSESTTPALALSLAVVKAAGGEA